MKRRLASAGFTLIELLVTLTLMTILVTFAVPSFERVILDNRLSGQVTDLSSLVAFARSEATKRSDAVITLCPTADNAECSDSDNWEDGWMVLLDWNGNKTLDTGAGGEDDQLLRVAGALSGGNRLRTTGFSAADFVQFDGGGRPIAAGSLDPDPGTFVICDRRGANLARGIVVMASGQLRMATDADNNQIVEAHDGNDVVCP